MADPYKARAPFAPWDRRTLPGLFDVDAMFLGPSLDRLGELYETHGNAGKAAEYYRRFIELWKNADVGLQPQVQKARERVKELQRRTG